MSTVLSSETLQADRRSDIDAKQEIVRQITEEKLESVGALLLMPAHVAWFTCGMNIRGMIADGERPGIFIIGQQRWLVCSAIDTQRLFDQEIDGMGFMLKEWQWNVGRAALLGELVAQKKIVADRPFPNMPLINDALRPNIRVLHPYDIQLIQQAGAILSHSIEATARTIEPGTSEEEIAGQIAHRIFHHRAEALAISISADDRGSLFRRAGYTSAPVNNYCTMQATALFRGIYVTCARTVSFGEPSNALKQQFDVASRLCAIYASMSRPGKTIGNADELGRFYLQTTPFEHEWRYFQPAYGAGWFAAEELRRGGLDEEFVNDQPVTWQARIGNVAVVDTLLVHHSHPVLITEPSDWPYKRIKIKHMDFDIPDIFIRR